MKNINNKKISVLVAFRIMQEIYSPLIKRYRELFNNGDDDTCSIIHKFVLLSHDKCLQNDISWFSDVDMTFSCNVVAKNVIKLHDKYYKDFGENLMFAFASVFNSLWKDIQKLW